MSSATAVDSSEPHRYDSIPDEFKDREQWLLWDSSADTPRRPHWNGDFGISWSNPDEWHSFSEAVSLAQTNESWGIGYVTAADNDKYPAGAYGVIDIDGAFDENGNLKDWVPDLEPFSKAATYMERSPRTGIHIPFNGAKVPDWWSDTQIGDHEGIDVLTNKFCTFTGDTLPESGSGVAPVDPTSWLLSAYEELNGEPPNLTDETDTDYSGDEWLTDSHVENALSHIDPDISHPEWVRLGYAVHDYDSGSNGKSLFESWSRKGSKYDDDAAETIAKIWSDASAGGGVTVATLVHKAKQQGWELPARSTESSEDSDLPNPSEFDVRNGGYAKYHPPRDDDGDGYHEQLTNFQIETISRLTHRDGTREYHLRIHPADAEPYEIHTEPVVFNDLRSFRSDVLNGWTATFDGNQNDLNRLKEFVATQEAQDRIGTKLLGLHGDEFVTPDGALTVDGWADDPDTVLTDADHPLSTAIDITPDDGADYDETAVREILRLLPQTRNSERFLPVLGWFYAAPFRPHIQEWSGEFNLLNVLGDTGSGKTSTLETLWRLFGVNEELREAKATPFSIMRTIASSNALPVIFDEYKPTEIPQYRLDALHSNLRESTRGGVVTKGNSDMSVDNYYLQAPVCISGEQPIQGPAEERRTILTVFKRDVTVGDTPEQKAYARLVGGEANGTWYDGYELRNHALSYYRWVLDQPKADVQNLWEDSRRRVMDLVEELSHENLDDTVIQGFQTIKFGTTLYRAFADAMGVDPDETGVTTTAVNDAIRYVADSGTGAEHTSHLDRLLGLMNRAARSGYLSEGDHYKVIHQHKPNAELRVHLPTAFDQIRRYARDHDIQGDDLLSSADDYKARIRDAADDPTSYITTASQNTPPLNRCVGIHVTDATEQVDGFEPESFGTNPDGETSTTETSTRFDPQPLHKIADDPTGYPTVKGEIKTVDYPAGDDSPTLKATLVNGKTAIDVIAWERIDDLPTGEQLIIENADTSEFDGTTQLVIKQGVTGIHPAPDKLQQQIEPIDAGGETDA